MKKVFIILICVVGLIVLFLIGTMIFANLNTIKLNTETTIERDKIKLIVHGSEKVTIDKGELNLANGEYIKVKLTLENYGTENYSWTGLNFSLGDEIPAALTYGQDDILKHEISSGEKTTGYLYFPVTDETILEYTTNMKVEDSTTISVKKYRFKIK